MRSEDRRRKRRSRAARGKRARAADKRGENEGEAARMGDEEPEAASYEASSAVKIHLSHDTSVDGHLLHYHKYYNIALFEVSLKQSPQLFCLSDEVKYAQESTIHGSYMYVNCGVEKCGAGGPALNFDGNVVGMADSTPRTAFIPISILVRCLHMQKECIPWLQLGLKFSSIKFMEVSHIEQIINRFSIDSGLIVQQVLEGSVAEKIGIRNGDIIKCLNGEHVSTTVDVVVS
ncbi:uncharacterized protein C2845_PM06G07170 [Panicum miliaceum]|uniref:PDZ domain-containing protein n=1 Tax=Panicum miliaceum TaxID=4540 RepID=A0A3L6R7J8_PANMI|nr:uncharacterized protein C2845_PM06G07170 [Panicum miliaceum]